MIGKIWSLRRDPGMKRFPEQKIMDDRNEPQYECPECGRPVWDDGALCEECRDELEWTGEIGGAR
jgi:uncharacterized OB-fold protein